MIQEHNTVVFHTHIHQHTYTHTYIHAHACTLTHTHWYTHTQMFSSAPKFFHLLDMFNNKLSLGRYWQGPRCQVVEEGRGEDSAWHYTVIARMILHWDGQWCQPPNVSFIVEEQSHTPTVSHSNSHTTTLDDKGEMKRNQTDLICLPAWHFTPRPKPVHSVPNPKVSAHTPRTVCSCNVQGLFHQLTQQRSNNLTLVHDSVVLFSSSFI